ncbi:MAG: FliH/SctL family protein, partial [Ilumatobacteraceae bacterium]
MTRVLHSPSIDQAPVDVPAPPAWDSVALSAYEQGFDEGGQHGRELGRRDLREMQSQLDAAVDRCLASMEAASKAMAARVIDVSELYVTTALRHIPDARTAGMLVRLGEVLQVFEPGSLEVSVAPDLVAELTEILAPRNVHGTRVKVAADANLLPGEFRLHSEWADADGTFERYLAAARNALELHL